MTWNDPREELRQLVKKDIGDKPFSELSSVIFNHDGAVLAGHALIDVLEENGFDIDDFDAVGALTAASVPFVSSMITAAASRGQSLDGFALDFVFPGIKGTDIKGKLINDNDIGKVMLIKKGDIVRSVYRTGCVVKRFILYSNVINCHINKIK